MERRLSLAASLAIVMTAALPASARPGYVIKISGADFEKQTDGSWKRLDKQPPARLARFLDWCLKTVTITRPGQDVPP